MVSRMTVLSMTAALASCGTDPTGGAPIGVCAPSAPVTARCGTGVTDFAELHDGDPVFPVFGPQGGWHVWAGVETTNSGPDVVFSPTITLPDQGNLRISAVAQEFVALGYDPETCAGSLSGRQARIDSEVGVDVCDLDGETVHLRIDVTDLADARAASCEVDVVIALDAAALAECDSRG